MLSICEEGERGREELKWNSLKIFSDWLYIEIARVLKVSALTDLLLLSCWKFAKRLVP